MLGYIVFELVWKWGKLFRKGLFSLLNFSKRRLRSWTDHSMPPPSLKGKCDNWEIFASHGTAQVTFWNWDCWGEKSLSLSFNRWTAAMPALMSGHNARHKYLPDTPDWGEAETPVPASHKVMGTYHHKGVTPHQPILWYLVHLSRTEKQITVPGAWAQLGSHCWHRFPAHPIWTRVPYFPVLLAGLCSFTLKPDFSRY